MIIKKNGIAYLVKETSTGWTLTTSLGNVSVSFNIAKADCPTLDALKEFIATSDEI